METKYTISDIDGRNPRQVTLAEFMADHEARKAAAAPIMAAVRRGDLAAVAMAQASMRNQFPK